MYQKINKKPLVVAIALASSAGAAIAETASLEEVVVTAQKREQNLQQIPVAVSTFDENSLLQKGISDIEDASQFIPNVQIVESPSGSTGATIGIRGSVSVNPAVTFEPTVGLYYDGVFIAKNVGGIFDVAELERIEVLRGPQGTLYGKNTIGGAVNIVTRKPKGELGGRTRIGIGEHGATELFASLDTATINDQLSFNVAISKKDRDGFYDNEVANGIDEFKKLDSTAGRIASLFDVSEDLEVYYTYDWAEKDNTPTFGQRDTLGAADAFERKDGGTVDGALFDKSETSGHAIHLTYNLNDKLTLKSITATRDMSFDDSSDYDGTAVAGFHTERHVEHEQTSQELQLIGSSESFDFVAGIFYFDEKAEAENPFISDFFPGIDVIRNFYGVDSKTYAAYTQIDWHTTDKLTLSAGVRFNEEEKQGFVDHPDDPTQDWPAKNDETWNNTSPNFIATYDWTTELSAYAKVAKGWKAGGFNGEAQTVAIAETAYDEEEVTSYEIGAKTRWLENRLQANVAVFQNDVENLQLSEFFPASFYSVISNAAESTIKGAELEILAVVTSDLGMSFNYGYLDAEYDKFLNPLTEEDLTDTARFPYAPQEKVSLGLLYERSLSFASLSANLDWSYVDDHFVYHAAYAADVTRIKAYDLINARFALSEINLGSGDQTLAVSLWGKNLADEEYRVNGIPVQDPGVAINYYGDPRTVGMDVTFEF